MLTTRLFYSLLETWLLDTVDHQSRQHHGGHWTGVNSSLGLTGQDWQDTWLLSVEAKYQNYYCHLELSSAEEPAAKNDKKPVNLLSQPTTALLTQLHWFSVSGRKKYKWCVSAAKWFLSQLLYSLIIYLLAVSTHTRLLQCPFQHPSRGYHSFPYLQTLVLEFFYFLYHSSSVLVF